MYVSTQKKQAYGEHYAYVGFAVASDFGNSIPKSLRGIPIPGYGVFNIGYWLAGGCISYVEDCTKVTELPPASNASTIYGSRKKCCVDYILLTPVPRT